MMSGFRARPPRDGPGPGARRSGIRIAAALGGTALLAAGLGVDWGAPRDAGALEAPSGDAAPLAQADLVIAGLRIVGGEGGGASALAAETLRLGELRSATGLFVYHDLKSLHVSGAEIRLRPRSGSGVPAPSIDLLEELSRSFAPAVLADEAPPTQRSAADLLARVRIQDLSILVELPGRRSVSILATRARTDAAFDSLVASPLVVLDADGRELRAPEAVWSREPSGLYLPRGYSLDGRPGEAEALFVLSDAGSLLRRPLRRPVSYRDPVEELETQILGGVLERAPVLGAVLGFAD